MTVFAEGFKPAHKLTSPETTKLVKSFDGSCHGEVALNAIGMMNPHDEASCATKDWKLVLSMENNNSLVRRMRLVGKLPQCRHSGFEILPKDLTVTGDAVLVVTFSGGKIVAQFQV